MVTWLHIGERETSVRVGDGAEDQEPVTLAIGLLDLARRHFHHAPATTGELEAAIETVEDILMPAIPRLRGSGPLVTCDEESRALLAAVGLPEDARAELVIHAVERLFNRLADVAGGRPAASEGLPPRPGFAANLLILRELMHHAGRTAVVILPADEKASA